MKISAVARTEVDSPRFLAVFPCFLLFDAVDQCCQLHINATYFYPVFLSVNRLIRWFMLPQTKCPIFPKFFNVSLVVFSTNVVVPQAIRLRPCSCSAAASSRFRPWCRRSTRASCRRRRRRRPCRRRRRRRRRPRRGRRPPSSPTTPSAPSPMSPTSASAALSTRSIFSLSLYLSIYLSIYLSMYYLLGVVRL